MAPKLVLASQSVPRKLLLERLKIPFAVMPSAIAEDQKSGESPIDLVERLSIEKAQAVAKKLEPEHQSYIIIGSDQVAVFNNTVYGKPGDYENAFRQLKLFNNQTIEFITGLCLVKLDADGTLETQYTYELSSIKLRNLTDEQIESYLHKDQPYQCAASFKVEGLGISLVEQIDVKDFSAIIGLPMIQLITRLETLGLSILK